jgi:hypothetical protein
MHKCEPTCDGFGEAEAVSSGLDLRMMEVLKAPTLFTWTPRLFCTLGNALPDWETPLRAHEHDAREQTG